MIYPYWQRRSDLDAEIQSLMSNSELTVYLDSPHNCLHIMRGDEEFTSILYPLNDQLRDELRQQAYLLHNGMTNDEIQRIKEANKKVEQYNKMQLEEAKVNNHNFGVWEYEHRFLGREVKPMIIVPGVTK